jgi:hypothetical protein
VALRRWKVGVVLAALAAGCVLGGCGDPAEPGLVDSTTTATAAAPTSTGGTASTTTSSTAGRPTTSAVPLTTAQTGPAGQALTFRRLTIQLRPGWRAGGGGDHVTVAASRACRRSIGGVDCPGFLLLGPSQIAISHKLGPYDPARPWHPGTGVEGCPMDRDRLYESGGRLRKGGFARVGGRKAQYREWRITCVDARTSKPKSSYVQRVWHLPASRILIVDEWSTPALAGTLAAARFG